MEEEEIEDEIREADLVNELIQLTITRIEDFLEASRPPTKNMDAPKHKTPVSPSVSADPSDVKTSTDSVESPVGFIVPTEVVPRNCEPSNHSAQLPAASSSIPETGPRVKLPKLDVKKFDGEFSTWPTFWDVFESSIHKYEGRSWTKCSTLRFVMALRRFGTLIFLINSLFSEVDSANCQSCQLDSSAGLFCRFVVWSCRFVVSLWCFVI